MERLFHLKENGTTVRKEIIAGITTFMTMAYILSLNPGFLADAGMEWNRVFSAVAISSAIACAVMGLYAKLPFALAPGVGLGAFFTYTVCLGMGYSWQFALTAIFVEGIIFVLLTILKVREDMHLQHSQRNHVRGLCLCSFEGIHRQMEEHIYIALDYCCSVCT